MPDNNDNRFSPSLGGGVNAPKVVRSEYARLTGAYTRRPVEIEIDPNAAEFELALRLMEGDSCVGHATLEGSAILNLYDALGLLIAEVFSKWDEDGDPHPHPRKPGDELVDGAARAGIHPTDRELALCTEVIAGVGLSVELAEASNEYSRYGGAVLTAAGCRAMLRACHGYLAVAAVCPEAS